MSRKLVVRGFHGTTTTAARLILDAGFKVSRNDYDWLGDGVYFFQDAPLRAWEWAEERYGAHAAVVSAGINLEDCIDLLDIAWWKPLREAYELFLQEVHKSKKTLPIQTFGARRLDRQVLNYAIGSLKELGLGIRSVRGVFVEGDPLYPNSELYDRSHIQISVRETSVIESIQRVETLGRR